MTQAKQDAPRDGTEFEAGHHLIIGDRSYRWDNIWAGYEGTGWSHSGIAALQDDSVVFAHPEGHRLVRVLPGGEAQEIHTELTEMHAIVAAPLAGREALWVADNGSRYCHGTPDYHEELNVGRVAALDMEGSIRQEIHCPDLPAYAENRWRPTTVAVDGQTGDIWVGDGYGASLVHCFDAAGQLRFTLDGTEAGKHFASPHGVHIRLGGGEREVYVADRGNRRIVVYGLDGAFRRVVGVGHLSSPSSLAELDGTLLVTELSGALAMFDGDDFRGHAGQSGRDTADEAWPNQRGYDGTVTTVSAPPGVFNSPHGIAVQDGHILLTEWMVGGRFTRLSPDACVTAPLCSGHVVDLKHEHSGNS